MFPCQAGAFQVSETEQGGGLQAHLKAPGTTRGRGEILADNQLQPIAARCEIDSMLGATPIFQENPAVQIII